ncbi:MAG: signal transduction protein [Planctomycetota bacterium]
MTIIDEVRTRFPAAALPDLPEQLTADPAREIVLVTNADLRESANVTCWPVQQDYEQRLERVLGSRFGRSLKRAHPIKDAAGHGFIACQREGSDVFAGIDPDAPVIVLMTAWQYSHHIAPSLLHHRGPILLLANFDGTWPGLVGMLCLCGTLTGLGRAYSRLWSEAFEDEFFLTRLDEWLRTGAIAHDTSHLQRLQDDDPCLRTDAGRYGAVLAERILRRKEIMGLFDNFCMGMMNGVFPQQALCRIGVPMEGLSQSALLAEMEQVPQELREQCLQWYIDRGMDFRFGSDEATELTRAQVLSQCAMLIAAARICERFGCTSIGIQYQQGLKDQCPASDFAEGALGSSERFPIPGDDGAIIRPGKPIPCINEVDMGTGIPQTLLFRLLDSLGLPAETTLHDVRWGSEYAGTFYWDFEISGNVPFEHLRGGIAGATGHRQNPMYFRLGGSTITGQCKAGTFCWARAHYEGTEVHMHIGTGLAHELPQAEYQRRLQATTDIWPLMNVTLDGIDRDHFMAGHQSNHITVAYVPEDQIAWVCTAFAAQCRAQGMIVHLAGTPRML